LSFFGSTALVMVVYPKGTTTKKERQQFGE
jgi:hypothetical protein